MDRRLSVSLLVAAAAAAGCTTLGPMPATTGFSAVPVGRPSVEVQAGAIPAVFLSDAARDNDGATMATQQISGLLEPDRLLGTKGVVVGARSWGESGDSPFEPMIGLRRRLDDRFALGGFAYGTRAVGASRGASYAATRFGGELALDGTLLQAASWFAIHVQATASATYVSAHGQYCVGQDGQGIDCDRGSRRVEADVEGIYTTATAGMSLDFARRSTGFVHGVRIAMLGAIGGMPRIRDGVQQRSTDQFHSVGLTLTLGLGSAR